MVLPIGVHWDLQWRSGLVLGKKWRGYKAVPRMAGPTEDLVKQIFNILKDSDGPLSTVEIQSRLDADDQQVRDSRQTKLSDSVNPYPC